MLIDKYSFRFSNGISNALLVKLFERDNLNDASIEAFVDDICLISHHQKINFLWRPFLHDPQDDMVLETAFNAESYYEFCTTHT